MRLDLAETGQVVFNRIFSRRNVDFRRIDFVERTVQRRRLTRTRRTCNVDNSVGLIDHPSQLLDGRAMDNDFVQREQVAALVENTHDDLLAKFRGDC